MDLDSKKVPELKEMAKELGIEGADGMKKAELIDAISSVWALDFVKVPDAETSEEVAEPKKMKKASPSGVDESIPGKYRKFMK